MSYVISPSMSLVMFCDQVHELYVMPHLDCDDTIYHKYDPDLKLDFPKSSRPVSTLLHLHMSKLEYDLILADPN